MSLKIFNTLTRKKEDFKPLEDGKVKMYSCGQTIYDDLHIGNARAYVAWDTLRRYLEWKGYTVRHVQNITDVGHLTDDGDQGEDKVEKRAKKLDLEPMELVEDQIERYFEDTKALNIERQDIVPRATGHINEMIYYIKKILENGYAYEVEGNIYFDVEAFAEDYNYGSLAKKDLTQLKEEAESRIDPDPKKKNQYDFALWINAPEEHLMKWESPWSEGYPGWHLECSVMGQKYLGDEFDIHAGGKDHIFPHHPNERAQALAATDSGQARYWLHNEFIHWEGEKMSKSKGNFITVRELLEDYSGNVIRLYLNSSHYRTEADFTREGLEKAEKELKRVRRVVKKVGWDENPEGKHDYGQPGKREEGYVQEFVELMDDDLNTAKAKQFLMKTVSDANEALEKNYNAEKESLKATGYANFLIEAFGVLGVDVRPEVSEEESEMADLLLEVRQDARERKDYDESDLIRDKLQQLGFEIEDTEDGALWIK